MLDGAFVSGDGVRRHRLEMKYGYSWLPERGSPQVNGGYMTSGRVRGITILTAVAVPVMLIVALLSWALASPVGASPDDDYHMTSIWCGGGTDELCKPGLADGEMLIPKDLLTNCYAFHPENSGACSRTASSELVNSSRGNFAGGYPPVFYAVLSIFASSAIDSSILLMRGFNALLFVSVVSLLFFLLPRKLRAPYAWGTAITLVPLGMFIVPSVNPSSWAVLSAATLWASLVAYFTAKDRKKQVSFGVIASFAVLVGAGARSDAAVYACLAMVVAVILTAERSRRYAIKAILPVILAVMAIIFFFMAGQSSVVSLDTSPDNGSVDSVTLALANLVLLPELWTGALGTTGLGWLDTAMPGLVWVSTLAVFFAFVFWGLQRMGARKALALGLVFASLVIIPLYVLVKDQVMVGAGVQPRYIYPLLIILAGVALWRLKGRNLQLTRFQLSVVTILLTVANSVALHTNIRRYVTGIDGTGANLNRNIEWWWQLPLSPMAVWIAGSIAFGIAMLGLAFYSFPDTPLAVRPKVKLASTPNGIR